MFAPLSINESVTMSKKKQESVIEKGSRTAKSKKGVTKSKRGTAKTVAKMDAAPDMAPSVQQDGHDISVQTGLREELSDIEKRTLEAEALEERIRCANEKLSHLLHETEEMQLLLAAFNASVDDDGGVELAMPNVGDVYYYIRAAGISNRFEVIECVWKNGISDFFRYCKLNVMMNFADCDRICEILNRRLASLLSQASVSFTTKYHI